jgi:hypothetical protein
MRLTTTIAILAALGTSPALADTSQWSVGAPFNDLADLLPKGPALHVDGNGPDERADALELMHGIDGLEKSAANARADLAKAGSTPYAALARTDCAIAQKTGAAYRTAFVGYINWLRAGMPEPRKAPYASDRFFRAGDAHTLALSRCINDAKGL